jgi:RHH-type transcriptional regulator, rel operon repressor / antitoxin RelB
VQPPFSYPTVLAEAERIRKRRRRAAFGRKLPLAVCECIQDNTHMSEVMTIRVDRKTKTRLEKLAKAMERTKSYLAAEAIRTYIDLNEWQIAEIKAALKEADAGDFATPEEVEKVMNKWRRGAR